jgi:hypothetical protein
MPMTLKPEACIDAALECAFHVHGAEAYYPLRKLLRRMLAAFEVSNN